MDKELLNKQAQHWEKTFSKKSEMFGVSPSVAATKARDIFKKKGYTKILEIGAGQGRDTFFFAENGFNVHALDYSQAGINNITQNAKKLGLSNLITATHHDIRKSLPYKNTTFDACFSHMLYCMALTKKDLKYLSGELYKVLKTGGINIYTARNTQDGDYKNGFHVGENLYENDGFIVHFFSHQTIKEISDGFKIINIEKFEEGKFPRKLFIVTLKKVLVK